MRTLVTRLSRLTLGYGAVQWSGPLLSLVFTPIITRLVSPSDYGVADYAQAIAGAIGMVALFAQPQALAAHFNDEPESTWHGQLTASSLALALSLGIPLGIAVFFLAPWIATTVFGEPRYTLIFQIIGGSSAFGICSAILTAAAQAALRARWGLLFSLVNLLAIVTGNVLFVIALRLGALGLILTPTVAALVVSLSALMTMRRWLGRPARQPLKLLAVSGMTLLPTMLAGWSLTLADRLFLAPIVSPEALGHYAIANKVAGLVHVAMTPLYTSWTALALSMQHEPLAAERSEAMARYLLATVLSLSLGLGLFASEILTILTRPAYLPAAPFIGALTYVHVFTGLGALLYTNALATKQLSAVSWTVGAGAVLNLGLNIMLIPSLGVWGATLATVAGYGVPQALLYIWLRRRTQIQYPIKILLTLLVVHAGLLAFSQILATQPLALRVVEKAALFGVLLAALVLTRLITPTEVRQGLALARSQAQRLLAARARPRG